MPDRDDRLLDLDDDVDAYEDEDEATGSRRRRSAHSRRVRAGGS